jgi:hypothetical protein
LNWDGIERIVDNGIKLKTGEIVPLDVIIFATGFSVVSSFILVANTFPTRVIRYPRIYRFVEVKALQWGSTLKPRAVQLRT